jgi:hypothetical protein
LSSKKKFDESAPGYQFFQLATSLIWLITASPEALIWMAFVIRTCEGIKREIIVVMKKITIRLIKKNLRIRIDFSVLN